jgi:hypothetical protein
MKKTILSSASLGIVLACVLVLFVTKSPSQEALDPLKVSPDTHKLVFENKFVRVIEARIPPKGSEPKHSHPHGVTVYLASYDSEVTTFPEGKTTKVHRTFGTALWSEAVVHEVKNTSTTPAHAFRIELKY